MEEGFARQAVEGDIEKEERLLKDQKHREIYSGADLAGNFAGQLWWLIDTLKGLRPDQIEKRLKQKKAGAEDKMGELAQRYERLKTNLERAAQELRDFQGKEMEIVSDEREEATLP